MSNEKISDCELSVMAFVEIITDRIIKETTASPVISPRVKNIETRHQEAQTTDINNEAKRTDDIIQALCITVQYLTQQVIFYFLFFKSKTLV